MNEEDPEFEKTLRAINHYYITQVGICTAALSKLRSAELSDKNIIIRAIMCDMPDCGVETEASADDCGVDLWADRAEYVNETSFNLYVTQAEENVLDDSSPKPPASDTAATSGAREIHCMQPCTMGYSIPSISVSLVRIIGITS